MTPNPSIHAETATRLAAIFPDTRGTPGIPQLRAAFEEILDEVREIAPVLAGVPLTAAGIAGGGPKVAPAYLELERLSGDHVALRRAQAVQHAAAALRDAPIRQVDPDTWPNPYAAGPGSNIPSLVGWFLDSRALPPVDPNAHSPSRTTAPRPGPDDPLGRLLWLATDPAAEPWLPTPEEQDARFAELLAVVAEVRRDRGRRDRTKVIPARLFPPSG